MIKKFYFSLEYLNLSHIVHSANLFSNFKPKELKKFSKPIWPAILHLAQHFPFGLNLKKCFSSYKDMELIAYAIGQNPISDSKIQHINLSKNVILKEGAKLLAPSLEYNKNLISLDLSHTKIGVSGMVQISLALLKNDTLRHLNLYRNIIDVDGARSLGRLLKVNTSLEFLDVGHNRIR